MLNRYYELERRIILKFQMLVYDITMKKIFELDRMVEKIEKEVVKSNLKEHIIMRYENYFMDIDLISDFIGVYETNNRDNFLTEIPTEISEYSLENSNKYRYNGIKVKYVIALFRIYKKVFWSEILEYEVDKETKYELFKAIADVFDYIFVGISDSWIDCNCNCSEHINLLESKNNKNYQDMNTYREIFESIPCPMFIFDNKLKLHDLNISGHEYLIEKLIKPELLGFSELKFKDIFACDITSFISSSDDYISLRIDDSKLSKIEIRKIYSYAHNIKSFLVILKGEDDEI